MERKKLEILGIWIGSPAKLPSLQREGIFRFLFNLVKHLSLHHPLKFEIWCQQINLVNVRALFSELLEHEDIRERISFCTEMNAPKRFPGKTGRMQQALFFTATVWLHYLKTVVFAIFDVAQRFKRQAICIVIGLFLLVIMLLLLSGPSLRSFLWIGLLAILSLLLFAIRGFRTFLESFVFRGWEIFKRVSNLLPWVANNFSVADCFLIQNFDIANAWKIDRLKVINLHDLYTSEFASLFKKSGRSRRLLFQGQKAARYAERLARGGSFFVSNSDHIRRVHALALIPGLSEKNTGVIFLPAIIPEGIRQRLTAREAVLATFKIRGDYIFYPTHIRPYKNVLTLLKAFKIVLERGHDLSLVLTGNLADDADCYAYVEQNGLLGRIILTGEISEVDMYSLYRCAALEVVPTLSEGGFPWQALEAMAMDIPVIVSRIPVVEERLRYHDLKAEACGLLMFEPRDDNTLAQMIIHVLANRAQVLSEQKTLRDTLLAYDWHQLSSQYYRLFIDLLNRSKRV